MNLFICIDDTDDLDSIGTGELLENMRDAAAAQGLGAGGFIVRYQLLIDDAIPYTSHNSSMCCTFRTDDRNALTAFCRAYLETHCADGSDPGLCILTDDPAVDCAPLAAFGARAQTEVVTKRDAYDAAEAFGADVSLSEHGGTGDGVIGALAGAGLRAGKAEGKIKGKLYPLPDRPVMTAEDFTALYGVGQIIDDAGQPLDPSTQLHFTEPTKALFRDGKVTCVVVREDGVLKPQPKRKKEKRHV